MTVDVRELTLLTTREVADVLRVSERTVRRKVAAGEIPALRLGAGVGPLRVDRGELEQWLYADPKEAA
jgi:excisionase family DNA binding protein